MKNDDTNAPASEPVGWQKRWKNDPNSEWEHVWPNHVSDVQKQGWVVRPLYPAPVPQPSDLDGMRYRRLRVLGCAPGYTKHLERAEVMRFTNLDQFVDTDLKDHPSRGEASPAPQPEGPQAREALEKLGTFFWLLRGDSDVVTDVYSLHIKRTEYMEAKSGYEWLRDRHNDAVAALPSSPAPFTTEQLDKLQFGRVLHDRPSSPALVLRPHNSGEVEPTTVPGAGDPDKDLPTAADVRGILAGETISPEMMKLQARKPEGGDWTDIYPAQLYEMAKGGNDVRAIEVQEDLAEVLENVKMTIEKLRRGFLEHDPVPLELYKVCGALSHMTKGAR